MSIRRRPLRVATRASALAQWQANVVAGAIRRADPSCDVVLELIETTADRRLDVPIDAMGGKGVFVKEVQAAVLDGRADLAVHSAKDLPASTPEGLVIAAFPPRADPRDVLVGCRFAELPSGARVATGSQRRKVQLLGLRPDLQMTGLRGNIATRLAKAREFDAIVMAKAALDRLELTAAVVDVLDPEVMLPQVGQGALAVECRVDDAALIARLSPLDDRVTRQALAAERAFLGELGGDCTLPAGAYATLAGSTVELTAMLGSDSLDRIERCRATGDDPLSLGSAVARRLRRALAGSPS